VAHESLASSLRWLFRYDPDMVDSTLRTVTPVPDMTVADSFLTDQLKTWAPDLYSFPFLSRAFVNFLVEVSDQVGRWEPEEGDEYGAPELRLRKISPGLEDVFADIIKRHVNPLLRHLYLGCYEIGWLQPPFLIRYDMHRQQDMGLHHDAESELTICVALNDDFEGGHLDFPRQGVSSCDVPVGHALMFPGGLTHLHRALPITSGERRTLTIWTRQDAPGDD
jgi:hypothetical protein